MKITIIHGQNHQGSTYHLAHMIADRTGGEITEFFLPKDFEGYASAAPPAFCATNINARITTDWSR